MFAMLDSNTGTETLTELSKELFSYYNGTQYDTQKTENEWQNLFPYQRDQWEILATHIQSKYNGNQQVVDWSFLNSNP